MSTATIEPDLETSSNEDKPMVERDRIQEYAERLRRDGQFQNKVLVDMGIEVINFYSEQLSNLVQQGDYTALNKPFFQSVDAAGDSVKVGFSLNPRKAGLNIEKFLKYPFQKQAFWEQKAAWILEKLDAWNLERHPPEAVPLVLSRMPEAQTGRINKESYLIHLSAFYSANELLQHLNLPALSLPDLETLLGLTPPEESEALYKLSKVQKDILTTLLRRTISLPSNLAETGLISWKLDELFQNPTRTDRVAISKSLQRLSERNLVQRLDIHKEIIPAEKKQSSRRTAFVRLTELGLLIAERLSKLSIPAN